MNTSARILLIGAIISLAVYHDVAWAEEIHREIVVPGEYAETFAPNHVKLNLALEASGATAQAVSTGLTQKKQNITKALLSQDKDLQIYSRGRELNGADGRGTPIVSGAVINVVEHLAIETNRLDLVALIIDESFKQGASQVTGISYSYTDAETQRTRLIREAIKIAQAKAAATAQELSLKLGQPLAVTVNEEDVGAEMFEQRMRGENTTLYQDRKIKAQVLVRYELIP